MSGTWRDVASMNEERCGSAVVLLVQGIVMAMGGWDRKTAETWDPNTNVWTPVAPMSTRRQSCACTPLPNGNVLVVGGSDDGRNRLNTAEVCELDAELRTPVAARAAALPPEPTFIFYSEYFGVLNVEIS